ncbi:hypothetical protein BD309DRAFT_949941 [Dichomitus squalens]|nr:hypothetical protein BD309DRAFT_949941 [Dichomitus squalens]
MEYIEEAEDQWFLDCLPGGDPPAGTTFSRWTVDFDNKEEGMYPGLARGLNSSLATVGWIAYTARCTHRLPDPTASGPRHTSGTNTFCPDLGIYPVDCPAHSQAGAGDRFRVSWPHIEVVIEVKKTSSSTTMTTADAPTSPLPLPHQSDRGQLIDYGIEVLNRQHRLFCFAIVILDDTARLLRYDRTGITMTSKFDYLERPEVIGRFFYRLSLATRMERGYDPTVVPSSAEEDKLFRGLSARFTPGSAESQALVNATSTGWPTNKITIDAPFSDGKKAVSRHDAILERHFLVGKPAFMGRSLVGRGTKAFVAYDMANDRVVFIKDSWRPDTGGRTQSEYDIYLQLREKIPKRKLYIPTLLGGGDVKFEGRQQQTRTPATRYLPRNHVRLVLWEVCLRLEDFTQSLELVQVIYTAFRAHYLAWSKAGILHRDVSAGNILIHQSGHQRVGLLADWDLAKTRAELEYPATQEGRSGTWPFMSACLQQFPGRPHTLADDLESFVHVLNWCLLKYIPNALSSDRRQLLRHIASVYDVASDDDPEKGSIVKYNKIKDGELFVKLTDKHPLIRPLEKLAALCKNHYYHLSLPRLANETSLNILPVQDVFVLDDLEDDTGVQSRSDTESELSEASGLSDSPHSKQSSSSRNDARQDPPDASRSPLLHHKEMDRVLRKVAESKAWPLDEGKYNGPDLVWDDQPSRSSNNPSTEPVGAPGSGSKRRKLDGVSSDNAASRSGGSRVSQRSQSSASRGSGGRGKKTSRARTSKISRGRSARALWDLASSEDFIDPSMLSDTSYSRSASPASVGYEQEEDEVEDSLMVEDEPGPSSSHLPPTYFYAERRLMNQERLQLNLGRLQMEPQEDLSILERLRKAVSRLPSPGHEESEEIDLPASSEYKGKKRLL